MLPSPIPMLPLAILESSDSLPQPRLARYPPPTPGEPAEFRDGNGETFEEVYGDWDRPRPLDSRFKECWFLP